LERPAQAPRQRSADVTAVASIGWSEVLLTDNELPWHAGRDEAGQDELTDAAGFVDEEDAGMKSESLLLFRGEGQGIECDMLMEVCCDGSGSARIDIFARKDCLAEQRNTQRIFAQHAAEVLAVLRDFCYDFRVRCLVNSDRPLSLSYVPSSVTTILRQHVEVEVEKSRSG